MSQFITDHPLFVFGCFGLALLSIIGAWSVLEQLAARRKP